MTDLSMPAPQRGTAPSRRLTAAGLIRRLPGRTITVRATQAGVTGSISKTAVAELHRLCADDYASNAHRRAQHRRDDAHLLASASEAVAAR